MPPRRVFCVQVLFQYVLKIDLAPLLGLSVFHAPGSPPVDSLAWIFGVVPDFFKHRLWLWQPATYLFLHAGLLHLGFNLLVLWMFGCELERSWGRNLFLKYYFLCGVGAGLCIALLSPAVPMATTIGASGALYGLLLAYGLLFPNRKILLWFVLPIKAKHFVLIIGAIAFYATITNRQGTTISHLATPERLTHRLRLPSGMGPLRPGADVVSAAEAQAAEKALSCRGRQQGSQRPSLRELIRSTQ